jgi:hypothetical protein
LGGGGNAAAFGSANSTAGTVNTGGGGGGASGQTGVVGANSGAGGSGIVIIRYPTADASTLTITGGTATTSGSYTIRTFTESGSLVIA